jgi:hypothetical protein
MNKKVIAVTAACSSILAARAGTGAVSFDITFKEQLRNGSQAVSKKFTIFTIKDLCSLKASLDKAAAGIHWKWTRKGTGMGLLLPEFKKDKKYSFFMSWDSEKGIFNSYVNGYPVRIPGTKLHAWKISKPGKLSIKKGPFSVENFKVYDKYISPDEITKLSPPPKTNPLLSCSLADDYGKIINTKRGKLLYNGSKIDPEFKTWKKEGPVKCRFEKGWEIFKSTQPKRHKHIVWWCPEKFPESFIAEWEIKIISEHGLCIIFFAAKGENGESIFAPSLPERDGTFVDYIKGKIKSYHISYLTNAGHNPGRPQVNLRKNNCFYLMSQGAAGMPFDNKIHKILLYKNKSRMFMTVDGRPVMDYTDNDAERYGKPYGDGWIGLRQMSWAVGGYRNFKVWEIKQ